MRYCSAKGVFDILPYQNPNCSKDDAWKTICLWDFVEEAARITSAVYGFSEIRTPLFEDSALFRSAGDLSDLVKKEMYTFNDRKGRSLTLRPEGTAPVLRALLQHGLHQGRSENKVFYLEAMFRYERQQTGRYRQHHQFGVESIGRKSPYLDAEIVMLMQAFFKKVGIYDFVIEVNCLGDAEARERYAKALQEFYKKDYSRLSPLSQERYASNPMRILDSKEPQDKELSIGVPILQDFVAEASLSYFETICAILKKHDVKIEINPFLVRGLDYYTDFVFEAICPDHTGSQSALGGGGRYDALSEFLGGPSLPSAGFGIGLERIIQQFIAQKNLPLPGAKASVLWIVPMDDHAAEEGFNLVTDIRQKGIAAELTPITKNLKNIVKEAVRRGISFIGVIGDEELKTRTLVLKNLKASTSIACDFNEIGDRVSR